MTDDNLPPDGIRVRRRKLSDYQQNPRNHNRGTQRGAEMLESSFETYGAGRSMLVGDDDVLIAGNQSQKAAAAAGYDEVIEVETDGSVPVVVRRTDLTIDDPRAIALSYADNITHQVSFDLNTAQVLEDIERGVDLSGIWTPEELAAITQPLIKPGQADDAPPTGMEAAKLLQEKWQTASGQLWVIDGHRLLCGDCRNYDDVKRLFNDSNHMAQMVVTSPPYAEQRAATYGGVPEAEYVDWFEAVQMHATGFLIAGGSFFLNIKAHSKDGERALYVFDLVLAMRRRWGWKYVDEFCWRHQTAPGRWPDRFRNGFEPVHQFARPGKGKFYPERNGHWSEDVMVSTAVAGVQQVSGTGDYYNISDETKPGLALPDNVIVAQGVASGVAHSAMFPVGLPEFFIKAYTDPGDIVYDPFMGGGTTMVAAHDQQRIAYGMEMLPEQVAVILERLAGNGLQPRLEV